MTGDELKDRLTRIESKLDAHLERLAVAETDIAWLSTMTKLVLAAVATGLVTGCGFIIKTFFIKP